MKPSSIFAFGTALCGLAMAAGNAQAALAAASGSQAEAQQPPATAAPAAEGQSSSGTSFSDTELEQFAKAVMAIQAIQKDATVPAEDKQTKAATAVQQSGMTPEKFNEIAEASQSDPALVQRIQLAAGKVQNTSTP